MNYIKIRKNTARKYYKNGISVILVPCKMRVDFNLGLALKVNKEDQGCKDKDFDTVLNAFENYNCGNETGRYSHFYIEDSVYNKVKLMYV